MMNKNHRSLLGMYTIGIAALFLMGFLLLVVFGAGSYRGTVDARESHSQQRALLSYITTSVQQTERGHVFVEDAGAADSTGANSEDKHAGSGAASGSMLVLEDGDTGYVTRIYLADGQLIEEYRNANTAPDPSQGRVIGKTSTFDIKAIDDELLQVTTDEGSVFIYVVEGGK